MKFPKVTRLQKFGFASQRAQEFYAKGLNAQSRGNRAQAQELFDKADRIERQYQLQINRLDRAA